MGLIKDLIVSVIGIIAVVWGLRYLHLDQPTHGELAESLTDLKTAAEYSSEHTKAIDEEIRIQTETPRTHVAWRYARKFEKL